MNINKLFFIFAFLGLSTLKATTEGGGVTYRTYLEILGRKHGRHPGEYTRVQCANLSFPEVGVEKRISRVACVLDSSISTVYFRSEDGQTKHTGVELHDALKIFLSALCAYGKFPLSLLFLNMPDVGFRFCNSSGSVERVFDSAGDLREFVNNRFEESMPYPLERPAFLLPALEKASYFFCAASDSVITNMKNLLLVIISGGSVDGGVVDRDKSLEYLPRMSNRLFGMGRSLSVITIGDGGDCLIGGERIEPGVCEREQLLVLSRRKFCAGVISGFRGEHVGSTSTMWPHSPCGIPYLSKLSYLGQTPDGAGIHSGAYGDYSRLVGSLVGFFADREGRISLYIESSPSTGKYLEASDNHYRILYAYWRHLCRGGQTPFSCRLEGADAWVYPRDGRLFISNEQGEELNYLYLCGLPSTLNMRRCEGDDCWEEGAFLPFDQ